jgi:hypothetical protein
MTEKERQHRNSKEKTATQNRGLDQTPTRAPALNKIRQQPLTPNRQQIKGRALSRTMSRTQSRPDQQTLNQQQGEQHHEDSNERDLREISL